LRVSAATILKENVHAFGFRKEAMAKQTASEPQMQNASEHQSKYAFVIAACCFLFIFVDVGMVSTSFNVYQPYIVELVGDAGGSLVLTFRLLASTIAMVFIVNYYHLLDLRVGATASMVFAALGFFIFGAMQTLSGFLLATIIIGISYGLGGNVAMTYAVNRWFSNDVASIIGVAATGSGICAIIMPPIITFLVETVSLSWAFWIESIVALILAVVVFALLRNRPSDLGLKAYHIAEKKERRSAKDVSARKPHVFELPADMDLSARAKVALAVSAFCVGIFCVSAASYITIHMTSNGFDPLFVGALVSLGGLCLTGSKVVSGRMYDRIGVKKGTAILYVIEIAGLVAALLIPTGNPLVAVICILGMYWGGALNSVGMPVWAIALSHPEDRSKLIKNVQVCYTIGALVFNFIPGFLVSFFGSYEISYALFLIATVGSMVVISVLFKKYLRARDAE